MCGTEALFCDCPNPLFALVQLTLKWSTLSFFNSKDAKEFKGWKYVGKSPISQLKWWVISLVQEDKIPSDQSPRVLLGNFEEKTHCPKCTTMKRGQRQMGKEGRGLLSFCHLLTLYPFIFIPLACVCVFVWAPSLSPSFPIEGKSYCKPAGTEASVVFSFFMGTKRHWWCEAFRTYSGPLTSKLRAYCTLSNILSYVNCWRETWLLVIRKSSREVAWAQSSKVILLMKVIYMD